MSFDGLRQFYFKADSRVTQTYAIFKFSYLELLVLGLNPCTRQTDRCTDTMRNATS